ncbi:MAG: branched-chain amino acid ABC transporter permease [Lactobacillales bacterium]|jgi:branched-chain amino acid transport system permease protein|nr:branched-chain amino acid ABC transporter permease [Lactobacillales bacterium]
MKKNLSSYLLWAGVLAALFAVFYVLYFNGIMDMFIENTLVSIGIYIILALGLNLILGCAGQFSLGHAGFMGIGAYATAVVMTKIPGFDTPIGLAVSIVIGAILAAVVAVLVGFPTLRLKGDYLAIATLGVAEIIRIVINNIPDVTNGPAGIFGIERVIDWRVVFVFVIIAVLIAHNYVSSSNGRVTLAVKDDEIAAEAMGVNTTKYKVMVFVIGAVLASVAGSLYATYFQIVSPTDFGFLKSVDILIIVVIGGAGSLTGTITAAALIGFLNAELQDFGVLRMIIYALILIIVMLFRPDGLLGYKELSAKSIIKFVKGRLGHE